MNSANPVYDTARTLLIEHFGLPAELVHPDATFEDMEVDSLALAEFAFVLQDRFGVLLGQEDATRQSTLTDLSRLLEARLATVTATATAAP